MKFRLTASCSKCTTTFLYTTATSPEVSPVTQYCTLCQTFTIHQLTAQPEGTLHVHQDQYAPAADSPQMLQITDPNLPPAPWD